MISAAIEKRVQRLEAAAGAKRGGLPPCIVEVIVQHGEDAEPIVAARIAAAVASGEARDASEVGVIVRQIVDPVRYRQEKGLSPLVGASQTVTPEPQPDLAAARAKLAYLERQLAELTVVVPEPAPPRPRPMMRARTIFAPDVALPCPPLGPGRAQ